ncbi:MAG: outer membrane lipoprotein carrier protein LolA [Acidobacteriota bacterium]
MRKLPIIIRLFAVVLAAVPPAVGPVALDIGDADVSLPALSEAQRLDTILARFDQAQEKIRTLEADFSEEKNLAILVEPLESTGRFFYASPDQAKWEYLEPDERVFIISENTLMQYFPADKLLERKDLRAANTGRLFKLFGMGQTSRQLRDFYRISLGPADKKAGTYQIILTPRRRAVEKRIRRVLLWVGDHDFLPRGMRYEEGDGDRTELHFRNVRINTALAQDTFKLDIPADVRVKKSISLFTNSGDGGAR